MLSVLTTIKKSFKITKCNFSKSYLNLLEMVMLWASVGSFFNPAYRMKPTYGQLLPHSLGQLLFLLWRVQPDSFFCKAKVAVGPIPKGWLHFVTDLEATAKVFPIFSSPRCVWAPVGHPRATEGWADGREATQQLSLPTWLCNLLHLSAVPDS